MTEQQWLILAGQFGGSGLALLVLGYLFGKVVLPMAKAAVTDLTAAIKEMSVSVREHTAADAVLSERLARLEDKIDEHLAWLRRDDLPRSPARAPEGTSDHEPVTSRRSR